MAQEARIKVVFEFDDDDLEFIESVTGETIGKTPDAGGGGGRGGRGAPTRGGGDAGGEGGGRGGINLGSIAKLATFGFTFREAIREFGGAVAAFTDAANRQLLEKITPGGRRGLMEVRAAVSAAEESTAQLGIAGAFATEGQMRAVYDMNRMLAGYREESRRRMQALSDPEIMMRAAPYFAVSAGLAVAGRSYLRR